jgi:hypothetical protein
MGKRGPRSRPPGVADVVALHAPPERPPVVWDRIVLKEEQAAEFLKCSPQTLRRRASSGEISRYAVGGEFRYYVYDLLDYALSERSTP